MIFEVFLQWHVLNEYSWGSAHFCCQKKTALGFAVRSSVLAQLTTDQLAKLVPAPASWKARWKVDWC